MRLHPYDVFHTHAHPAALLIRIAVSWTFLVSGSRKLMDLESAAGNFAGIGYPAPALLAGMVGTVEVLCGALVLIGLATRPAAIPLMAIMVMAIISTKLPTLVGGTVGPFGPPTGDTGFMPFMHAARLDVSMLLASAYLFWAGAGKWSFDARFAARAAFDRR
jgi:putative oxidoreductase